MKTLHLTNAWHETSGGIATFYRALIAEANRRRQEIRLIVPAAQDRMEQVGDFGKIYHLAAPKSLLNSNYRTIYPASFLLPGSSVQTILARERPDLIEISDKYTLNYLGALLRMRLLPALDYRPVIVGLSQERMDDNVRAYLGTIPFSQALCSAYMKRLYFPFFDHHIANSDYTAGELRSVAEGHLVPRGTWIRPMGVAIDDLSPRRRRPELRRRLLQNFGAGEEAVLLLYAGRLVPEKNLALLFDVLGRLVRVSTRDYRLLVVGDGLDRESWERKCAQTLPGRTFFYGHIRDREVLADLYANADVFVHPNPREPFGIAPLEAMASGLPLVAPNRGGVISYANLENAWTVEADSESFATAIEEVTTNQALAATKSRKALITAAQYRWDRVAASFLELYAELYRDGGQREKQPGSLAFNSAPAGRIEAALTRAAAAVAVRGFLLWSRMASGRANGAVQAETPHANTVSSQG